MGQPPVRTCLNTSQLNQNAAFPSAVGIPHHHAVCKDAHWRGGGDGGLGGASISSQSPVRRRLSFDDCLEELSPKMQQEGCGASPSPWRSSVKHGLAAWLGLQTPSPQRAAASAAIGKVPADLLSGAFATPMKNLGRATYLSPVCSPQGGATFSSLAPKGPDAVPSLPLPLPLAAPLSPTVSSPPMPPQLIVPPSKGWRNIHSFAVPEALLPPEWERIEEDSLVEAVYKRLEQQSRGVDPRVLHGVQRVLRYLIGSGLDVREAAKQMRRFSASRANCTSARIPRTRPGLRLDQLPHFERFVASVPFHPCVTFTPDGHPVALYVVNTKRPTEPALPIVSAEQARELLRRVGEYMDGLLFRRSEETHRLLGIITILDFNGAQIHRIGRLWFRILQPVVAESVRLVEDGYHTYIVNAPLSFRFFWRASATLCLSRRTASKVSVSSTVPESLLKLLGTHSAAVCPDLEASDVAKGDASPDPASLRALASGCSGGLRNWHPVSPA